MIPRYIDAESFRTWILKQHRLSKNYTVQILDETPTADVQEVKHGRWLRTEAYPHNVYCSSCYKIYAQDQWAVWQDGSLPRAYCPNCGAKMDGKENEQ